MTPRPLRVAVLCGGASHERAVSLRTGARVEQVLLDDAQRYEPTIVDVASDAADVLRDGAFDVAFIALHGRGGEDNQVQALCELLELPYTGTRNGPCGAAFHKARAKRLLAAAGVDTPPFISFSQAAIEEFGAGDVRDEAAELGYPLVVKPARGGSSLGVRFVDDAAGLPRALIGAMSYDTHVLLERFVAGREVSVPVLDLPALPDAGALSPVEVVPRNADWFDYESRYEPGETEFTCPPLDMDDATIERVMSVSRTTFDALDLRGFGRVDLIVDDGGRPWVLEASPCPGLTETSLMTVGLDAAGVDLGDVVHRLLDDALSGE